MDATARLPSHGRDAEQAAIEQTIAAFARRPRPVALRCGVQHYQWGDTRYIPALIGEPHPDGRPFAELWIGAHPDMPAHALISGTAVPLDRLIADAPEQLLGRAAPVGAKPGLPFLFKVLAADQPLSIQVHPNAQQAAAGFDRETAAGVPPDDPSRNYRDRNHKPELLVALTDFYALRGFKPLPRIGETLNAIPELASIAREFEHSPAGLENLYRRLMRLAQAQVDALLGPLMERLAAEHARKPFVVDDYRYWMLCADELFSHPGQRDRGLFSILLLNLIHLRPGQGIYLPAGELHSYLRGAGVELMANSNNVLRGGLTPKHIDVEELLRVVRFEAGPPAVIEADGGGASGTYRTPAREFVLERRRIARGGRLRLDLGSVALGLVLKGALTAATAKREPVGERLHLGRGQCFLVPGACTAEFRCSADAEVYLARAPVG
ncbi:MAG: mannose-6-phosphate isomerase, class I [Thiohalocapsa sp.]|nr:mannose-6-phosphate isomerase, class I [Thiohalocapsa sp.]MCF7989699.1 mannose-6-phosphate isomerase, class I [Thiohalocapsa sp.]